MNSKNNNFGWQLIHKIIENDITKGADILIAVTHWQLCKSGLLCLGTGDDKTFDETENGTELLPDGWNDDEKSYTLRYRTSDKLYILLGTISENTLIINLMDVKSMDVTNTVFDINDTVKSQKGSLIEIVPNYVKIIERIRTELYFKEFGKIESIETQTTETADPSKNLVTILPPAPFRIEQQPNRFYPPNDVGRGDLDPLGRGGGGMLYNPPDLNNIMPRFPNLARPPGARFDPFGPPDADPLRAGRRPNSNDHFRPPDYYDDMFM